MARCSLIALLILSLMTSLTWAVITAPIELSAFISEADHILVAKIEAFDADKSQFVLAVQDDLKGKLEFRKLPTVIRPDEDAVKGKHVPQLLKRLANDVPMILFISREGMEMRTFGFANGTWVQILGKQTDKDRAVWVLTHGEPLLRKMYKGTTAQLVDVVKAVIAGKAKAPKLDNSVEPGFGPELPSKSSLRPVLADPFSGGSALFAVIPTLGIAGPLAILAILFPTVFGGVLILFRQWTAFIAMFSVNSTLYLLYWWKLAARLDGTWLGSDVGIWTVMTAITLLCTLWAWRRQLANLSQGADALETPSRTEFLVLIVLSLTCAGFIVGTWILAAPPPTDLVWNMTLAISAGILFGLAYKTFRSLFEVMLPMPTEGVMLGISSLVFLGIMAKLTHLEAGPVAASTTNAIASPHVANAAGPVYKGFKWPPFQTKRGGLFVSSPVVANGRIYAAAAHPTFKFGALYSIDLATGKEDWKFNDGGSYKQPISSPCLAGSKIFIGEGFHEDPNCKLYGIKADDGSKFWEYQTASQTEATPVVVGDRVYLGCGNDGFFCFDAVSPNVVWRFPRPESKSRLLRFGSGATIENGRIYVGTGVDRLQKDDKGETAVYCLDAKTGNQIWKAPMPLPVWSTPVLNEDGLFVAIGNGDVFDDAPKPAGAVYKLSPVDGSTVWKVDLPNSVLQKPTVDEQHVYVGCRDHSCYALHRTTGEIVWKVGLGSPVIGTPALARAPAALYVVGSAGRVACLNPRSGLAHWSVSLKDMGLTFLGAPAVSVHQDANGIERLLIIGGGDPVSGAKATLVCLSDYIPAK